MLTQEGMLFFSFLTKNQVYKTKKLEEVLSNIRTYWKMQQKIIINFVYNYVTNSIDCLLKRFYTNRKETLNKVFLL